MDRKIKDLPEPIQNVALIRAMTYQLTKHASTYKSASELSEMFLSNAFSFASTVEGDAVWYAICGDNFEPFYQFHKYYSNNTAVSNSVLEVLQEKLKILN